MDGRIRPRKSRELKRKRRWKREIDASQGQMPESSKCKHRHRRRHLYCYTGLTGLIKTVKRFPFLSNDEYAAYALARFEELPDAMDAKFEISQVFGACRTLLRFPEKLGVVDWCHVSFSVKPRNSDGSDASPFFFFVELGDWGSGVLELMHYQTWQPDDSGITYDCEFCTSGPQYPHVFGYIRGLESVPLDATSQREMARCFKRQLLKSRCQVKRKGAKKHVPKAKREFDASQVQMPESSKSKHRHGQLKKTVKRFPFLPDFQYAKYALARYEKLTDTEFAVFCYEDQRDAENVKFEVVRVLGVCRTLLRFSGNGNLGVADWCHVSFTAKPRNADGSDASPVFFFVELADWGSGVLEPHFFRKSQPDDSGITYGCGFCPNDGEKYPHLSGYHGGSETLPLDDASQEEMARCFELQLINSRREVKPTINKEPARTYFAPRLPDCGYAEIALEHMNGEGNVEYEIVQTIDAKRQLVCFPEVEGVGEWCHVSFMAKPRNVDSNEKLKLIFAELVNFGEAKFVVNAYSILDPSGSGITYGCGFCPGADDGKCPHPADTSEYTAGHWPYMKSGCI